MFCASLARRQVRRVCDAPLIPREDLEKAGLIEAGSQQDESD
jgi:hypothetical protein